VELSEVGSIAVVCLGNICRSPMAEVVLRDRLGAAGLEIELASAGTGGWHAGEGMDERAAATLARHGYPTGHTARQWQASWRDHYDLVLAMDARNLADLGGPSDRVRLFRDLDPAGPGDVPDPWYGGTDGFESVLAMIERTADALVARLAGSTDPAGEPAA
jgi:protein-tyrosine phosphatase